MSRGWLDIHGTEGSRRAALREDLTRVGGGDADIALPGLGEDQLHLWNRPLRAVFVGRGPRPERAGKVFEECALQPGDCIEWRGYWLEIGGLEIGGAAPGVEGDRQRAREPASLEEITAPSTTSSGATRASDGPDSRLLERLRAGLACELGLVDPAAAKRWREAVLAQRFDPDACARELLPSSPGAEGEQRMLERSGMLLRDFLMAALLSGAAGARRKLRQTSRGLVALLVTQGLALLVFVGLVAAILLLLRFRGTSLDALLDRFLPR